MMLKILIIDDDMLTRKGIQTLMPWSAHNMTIVGEASNGQEALDFLAENPDTDLALVDIDMPIMNGTTFIEKASSLYPKLCYVVLTVHTEFEYIQQILRLGAIDYIAKTQFDQENFDQILNRIQAGVAKKNSSDNISSTDWKSGKILSSHIFALISISQEEDNEISSFCELNFLGSSDIYELRPNMIVFESDVSAFSFPSNFSHSMLMQISDVYEMTYSQLEKLLSDYLKNQFFYDYRPLPEINHKHSYELQDSSLIDTNESFDFMKSEWESLNWIHKNELFDKFKLNLKNCHLKPSQLYHFLLSLEMIWNSSYKKITGNEVVIPQYFTNWYEVENWLTDIYEKSQLFKSDSKYSNDVIQSIYSSKNYIDNNYESQLDATEIARNAGMSYGYFSRCFHDVIGQSFSDYCTTVRITHAQNLLENTNHTIQSIAYSVGYQDEKYFSRIFKKVTGMSPSEYRKN